MPGSIEAWPREHVIWGGLEAAAWALHVAGEGMERFVACRGLHVQVPQESSYYFLFSLCSQLRATWQWRGGGLGWAEEQKARFGAASGGLLSHESVLFWPGLHLHGNTHQS